MTTYDRGSCRTPAWNEGMKEKSRAWFPSVLGHKECVQKLQIDARRIDCESSSKSSPLAKALWRNRNFTEKFLGRVKLRGKSPYYGQAVAATSPLTPWCASLRTCHRRCGRFSAGRERTRCFRAAARKRELSLRARSIGINSKFIGGSARLCPPLTCLVEQENLVPMNFQILQKERRGR